MSDVILFSVAHSSAAWGAQAPDGQREYAISRTATFEAARNLAGEVPVCVFDVGPLAHHSVPKTSLVNALKPRCAIEIHCNGAENPDARYSEVIYHPQSEPGRMLAHSIAESIESCFSKEHRAWPLHGARATSEACDLHRLFFLEDTVVPAVIVEGVFLTNPEQAAWLASGGAEAYGLLVADGVRRFLSRQT